MTRTWAAIAGSAVLVLVVGVLGVLAPTRPDPDLGHQSMVNGRMGVSGTGSGGAVSCLRVRGQRVDVVRGEYEYLSQMIDHHEEAIAAAEELSRSRRPRLREFAAEMVTSQTDQVEQMEDFLADWYPGRPARTRGYRPQMRDLTKLSGDRLDRAFLIDMIGHHMMAVMQSQHLLARGQVPHREVGALARTIRDEQRSEIGEMGDWLRRWYPAHRMATPMMLGSVMWEWMGDVR